MIYMFLSNNPSSGDINLLNVSCLISGLFFFANYCFNHICLTDHMWRSFNLSFKMTITTKAKCYYSEMEKYHYCMS